MERQLSNNSTGSKGSNETIYTPLNETIIGSQRRAGSVGSEDTEDFLQPLIDFENKIKRERGIEEDDAAYRDRI